MNQRNEISRAVMHANPPAKFRLAPGRILMRLMVLTCLLTLTQRAWADRFLQEPSGFTAVVQGLDKIRFTLPTQYDGNQNEGISEGYIYFSLDGGEKKKLLYWGLGKGYNNLTSDSESGKVTINVTQDGDWQLIGKVKGGHRYFEKNTDVTYTLSPNDDDNDHFTTTVEWTVPRELRGKRIGFHLWCKSEDVYNSWYIPDENKDQSQYYLMTEWDCPAAAEVNVTLNDPVLAYDPSQAGSILIPYSIQAKSVKTATIYFTDAITGSANSRLLSTKLVDFACLPADRPWKDVYIRADLKDGENKDATAVSEKMTTNMLHMPRNLKAKIQPNGEVMLTWKVDAPGQDDIDDSDNFEVQRNVNGMTNANDEGWTTISMEQQFTKGQDTYTFVDNTLLDRYKGKPVAYRVRRSATTMWRWTAGAGYAMRVIPAALALPGFSDVFVQRSDTWNDEEHIVKFNYITGPKYDSDGRFIVRNDNDWNQLQEMVQKGQTTYKNAVMVLFDEADWEAFAQRVNNGARTLNAVMITDIDIADSRTSVGTTNNPFAGTFNGLGNTLTVNYNSNEHYKAPFGSVNDAKIHDLYVDGTIASAGKFAAALVGRVNEGWSVEISRCIVAADLVSQVDGDGSSGGLIGIMEAWAKATIDNSAFIGSIQGDRSNCNGGFIGVALERTTINITNSLFAPASVPFDTGGCRTFVRADQTATVNVDNCYYTMLYGSYENAGKSYYVIQNDRGWTMLKGMISQSGGSDINVIMAADITITETIGTQERPFRGVFNGNGHTITANIEERNTSHVAPFHVVNSAEIANLTVKGILTGGIHTAGLIGACNNNQTIKINNVHVAANITTTSTHAGGFIGHGNSATNLINNCRFDGTITSTGGSTSYAGAFIGWENGGTSNAVTNCLEMGTYVRIDHAGMNYVASGNAYGNINANKNNYSSHNWSELGDGKYRNVTDNSSLATSLGSEWALSQDGKVLPVMHATEIESQGKSGKAMTSEQLCQALGSDKWRADDDIVVPVMVSTTDNSYSISLWDSRAKLMLYTKMQGENGIETNVQDISGNEDAVIKHEFTHNLTRKCVEYEFELVVKRGTSPLNIAGCTADTLAQTVTKTDAGELASYKFMNMNQITKLTPEKRQSSVRLEWEVSGGDNDFYRVLRREHSNDADAEWTDTVANNLVQQFFEDKTVLVQQVYDYRVESVLQCEGTHITTSDVMGVQCEPTGRVSGYIRMADGTSLGGVTVVCTPGEDIKGADSEYRQTTDEAGFFEFKNLPYQTTGRYYIFVESDFGGFTAPNSEGMVVFNQNTNWVQNFNYYMDTYFVYSGNVFYRDTSIPVPGVSFKLDGKLMHDASQKTIVTDNQGAFTLSIPRGAHSVQAVKEGHYFANDGFLINEDAPKGGDNTKFNFDKNISGIYLWDSTTVVLRGRVAGGDDQGNLPLGQSLSVNNLGDSLKIVIQLEGDNASYLIRKQDDETIKSAEYKYAFGQGDKDTTIVNVTRHSMTVRPDIKTGEYYLELHPAKYKVVEISAQGYATLFQEGKVGETVDLAAKVKGDTCVYNRIYHSVPTVDVKQFNAGDEPYFGVKKVTASDNIGNRSVVNTWYWKKVSETDSIGVYSFNYPVFMSGSPYGWMLQACEKYYYNNVTSSIPDIVKLKGGKVNIKNDLIGDSDNTNLELDDDGGVSYIFTPKNISTLLTDEAALKTVSITLEYDNTFFDIKPMNGEIFKGYVMATMAKPQGRKALVASVPQLIDVLRDPPGGGSSAYLEAGSKLSYTYTADISGSAGLSFKFEEGTEGNYYNGTVIVPALNTPGTEAGTFVETNKKNLMTIDAITYYSHGWNFSYNFDVTERIQTSSGKKWVGAKADLFMGMTTDVMVEDAIALRVVPDSMYQIYKTHEGGSFKATDSKGNTSTIKVQTGTVKVLAEGIDDTGKPVYLIRDEVMAVGPKLSSTFVHSQHYIENELLPDLIKVRNALLLPKGTSPSYAKELANRRHYPTYVSRVAVDDVSFGYTDSYDIYDPDEGIHGDSICNLNQTIEAWLCMLADNEQQKLEVSENNLVKRYDFDGATSIQYSESFSAVKTNSRSLRYPGINDLGQITSGILPMLKYFIESAKNWLTVSGKDPGNDPFPIAHTDVNGNKSIEMKSVGHYMKLTIVPQVTLNFTDKSGKSETDSKKIGFTLSASTKSSMTVDVYRTATELTLSKGSNNFTNVTIEMLDRLRTGILGSNPTDFLGYNEPVFNSFVYRTRGGVTCQPYEGERATKWYQPGTVVDVATVPADKPRIWIDEPVVSNVPYDEPARFTLHFSNETDYPERATLIFNYFLLAKSNPKGAKVYVDGTPINSQGVNITLYPCRDQSGEVAVFTKQIEVYAGEGFDYEDLTLCLYDPEDASRIFDCKFSAHFVPTAGKVNVSSPGNKWVVNTESPYDGERKAWYMPVTIDGFNTNYRGFDHIELQYKLSTQSDKDWVSVCSYYADRELMAKASGVTDTIPGDGRIIAKFYGEIDPIEQYYDIRAVNYCRHGNGFLTRSSEVLTGIKDTRLPVAFGTPKPANGILGIGDDIMIQFSEPIAGNYLRGINNFEVLGQLNSNDLTTSTSLSFHDFSAGISSGQRNLSGKSFTVDVMLNPDNTNRAMEVFAHGDGTKMVSFGLDADNRLTATVNGQTAVSDSTVLFNNALHQVAYVLDQSGDNMTVKFFDGSKAIGSKELEGKYLGTSYLKIGFGDPYMNTTYSGDMLEFRLWNRALTAANLSTYGYKRLTGYETGLLNYYPMNEGEGDYAYDKTPSGNDIMLISTSWKRPSGISLELKGSKPLLLDGNKFMRTKDHDYTLMFWFRTYENKTLTLFSNGEAKYGQADQLNISLDGINMKILSSGFERDVEGIFRDGSWHHFAMTVNRSQNVANVYIDKKLTDSFAADSLSGIVGDHVALGGTYVDKNTQTDLMTGHIDEVGMFSSVLPINLIKEYATHTPIGTMSALMAYLDFGQSKKLDNNQQHLEPSGVSLKRYVDSQGKVLERRDTLAAASDIQAMASRSDYAPMVSNAQLDNLNYNFVSNDNQLYIDINEPDYMIEKTNVYVTVKDIPDLQGNLMASPLTMNLYVYRNPLRWDVKRISADMSYGTGAVLEATVKNLSSQSQNFTLEDLPLWITASQTSGTLAPLDELLIRFYVSDYINIGTYTEQISLVGDNSMSEPLPVVLRVRGSEPDWAVSDELRQMNQTMMMVARVKINGVVSSSEENILAAFDDNQQVLGVNYVEVNDNNNANEALVYLTIYGYTKNGKSPTLSFRFFDASSGNVYNVIPEDSTVYTFQKDAIVGSVTTPVVLMNTWIDVQPIELKKGWNWVTFIPIPNSDTTVGGYLNSMSKWEPCDKIYSVDGTTVYQWTCREDKSSPNGYRWDNENDIMNLNNSIMYNVYSMSDKTVYLEGEALLSLSKITVHKGWNRIAYVSKINLPIAQALNDYTEQASEGDVVKSQDGFAIASRTSNGLTWKGSLQFMEYGKGYMLKRQDDSEVSFYYPFYFSDTRYSTSLGTSAARSNDNVNTMNTMNIVANVDGVETEVGDRLVVYAGAERMTEAVADDELLYYLNIGSDSNDGDALTFTIEREGKTIAMTGSPISYAPNKVVGTPDEPATINFTSLDEMPHDGKWYNVNGILIGKKPTRPGVYIYNGQAVVVKN